MITRLLIILIGFLIFSIILSSILTYLELRNRKRTSEAMKNKKVYKEYSQEDIIEKKDQQ